MDRRDVQVSPREQAYHTAYGAFSNHTMGCRGCYAPNSRYCQVGEALHLEADARYLMTVRDRASRNRWLERDYRIRPAYADRLKERVIELFNAENGEE